jgi:hypothetical protein
MIAVCDMGPLHYLVLIERDHILPHIFDRVVTAQVITDEVLDEAAERGLIDDLTAKLEHLERRTLFFVGEKARVAIEGMKQRDLQRKQSQ